MKDIEELEEEREYEEDGNIILAYEIKIMGKTKY